jgi:hypothetical protein
LTINRKDFIYLHQQNSDHEGIIVCTQDPDVQGQAQRIHQVVKEMQSLSGQIIRINRPQK